MIRDLKQAKHPHWVRIPCPACHGQQMFCGNRLCEVCDGDGTHKLDDDTIFTPTRRGVDRVGTLILEEDERG